MAEASAEMIAKWEEKLKTQEEYYYSKFFRYK